MKLKLKHIPLLLLPFSLQLNAQEIKAELNKEFKRQEKMSYILDYPKNTKGNVPLIVFLHGSGERGNNLELVKAHSPFTSDQRTGSYSGPTMPGRYLVGYGYSL